MAHITIRTPFALCFCLCESQHIPASLLLFSQRQASLWVCPLAFSFPTCLGEAVSSHLAFNCVRRHHSEFIKESLLSSGVYGGVPFWPQIISSETFHEGPTFQLIRNSMYAVLLSIKNLQVRQNITLAIIMSNS